jgi:hypothetical protein
VSSGAPDPLQPAADSASTTTAAARDLSRMLRAG